MNVILIVKKLST